MEEDISKVSGYINSLNEGTIRKADMKLAEGYTISTFDPKTMIDMPGCVSITAMTGAGKTVLIKDLLSHTHKSFDKIYLISSTAELQTIYDFIPRENIMKSFDETFIAGLIDRQDAAKQEILKRERSKGKGKGKNKQEEEFVNSSSTPVVRVRTSTPAGLVNQGEIPKLDKVLVIMDDIIHDVGYKKSKLLPSLFTGGRHYDISVWILTQKFTSIEPKLRCNVRWAISFDLDSSTERESFVKSYMCALNARVGDLLFQRIVKEKPYQCVIVEIYKNGASTEEKVKKYIADPKVKEFKVKSINAARTKTDLEIAKILDGPVRTSKTPVGDLPMLRTRAKASPVLDVLEI